MSKSKKHSLKKIKINPTYQLLLAILFFSVSAYATLSVDISNLEISVFSFFYGLPGWLQPFFFIITQLGSIITLGVLLIIYLLKQNYHIVIRLLMTGTLAYLLAGVAKDIWGRARPNDILADVANLDYIVRGPGFPSGHMALATALGLTLAYYLPSYRWLFFVIILLVGVSRMYLGVHFPLDILGGFAIGLGSFALFRHVRLQDISHRKKKTSKMI